MFLFSQSSAKSILYICPAHFPAAATSECLGPIKGSKRQPGGQGGCPGAATPARSWAGCWAMETLGTVAPVSEIQRTEPGAWPSPVPRLKCQIKGKGREGRKTEICPCIIWYHLYHDPVDTQSTVLTGHP